MEDDQQEHQCRQVPVARRSGEDRQQHAVGRICGKPGQPAGRGLAIEDDQNRDVENDQDVNGDHGGACGDRSGEDLHRFVHVELAHHREHDHEAEMPRRGNGRRIRKGDRSQFRNGRAEEGPGRDDQETPEQEGDDVVVYVSGLRAPVARGLHECRRAECRDHEHREIEQDGDARKEELAVGARAGRGASDRPEDRHEQKAAEQRCSERDREQQACAGQHLPSGLRIHTAQATEPAGGGAQAVPVVADVSEKARRDFRNRREYPPADARIDRIRLGLLEPGVLGSGLFGAGLLGTRLFRHGLYGLGAEMRPPGALAPGRGIVRRRVEAALERPDQPVAGRRVLEGVDQGPGRGIVGCRDIGSRRGRDGWSGEYLSRDRIGRQSDRQHQQGKTPEHVREGRAVRRPLHRPPRRRGRSRGSDVPDRERAPPAHSSGSATPRPSAAAVVRTARESARCWRDRG